MVVVRQGGSVFLCNNIITVKLSHLSRRRPKISRVSSLMVEHSTADREVSGRATDPFVVDRQINIYSRLLFQSIIYTLCFVLSSSTAKRISLFFFRICCLIFLLDDFFFSISCC